MHNKNKIMITFWAVFFLAFLQIVNIYYAINKTQKIRTLFPSIIKHISDDAFICRSDTTIVYYLFRELNKSNIINTVLLIGTIVALIIYFRYTRRKSALALLCLNAILYFIVAVPFILEKLYGAVIKPSIYDFAFLTADYQNVPSIVTIYSILIAGYLFFFASCLYCYLKSRRAVSVS